MAEQHDLKMTLAVLDEFGRHAYGLMRDAGFSPDAAKDAVTVHVSDVLAACQRDNDDLPTPYDDEEATG